jgi:sporulation protein YlmC with PRC-barrel domain
VQLSELLGLSVFDTAEQRVGAVVDVRLAVGGDLDHHPDRPTVVGLLVSPHTRSSYLGYERSDARRPKVLAALLRRRHRGTFLALWNDVHRIDAESVSLRSDFTRYSPTLRDDD